MAVSRISGNQISTSTEAIITTLSFLNTNSVFRLPSGNIAQRPVGVVAGTLRYSFIPFLILVSIGKAGRYLVVYFSTLWTINFF